MAETEKEKEEKVDKEVVEINAEIQEFIDEKLREFEGGENPVAEALKGIDAVAKTGEVRDRGGKLLYKVATADSFYTAIRDKLAENKLSFWVSERAWKIIKVGDGNWLQVTYEFGLSRTGGRPAEKDLAIRTQLSPIKDAQSCQINETYAAKGRLRTMFLVATDADDGLEHEKQEIKGKIGDASVETRTETDNVPPQEQKQKQKQKEKPAAARNEPQWTLNEKTLEFEQTSGSPGTDKAASRFFIALGNALAPGAKKRTKAQLAKLQKTWEVNEWLVDGLPPQGKESLYKLAQQEGVKTSEFNKIAEAEKNAGVDEQVDGEERKDDFGTKTE